MRILFDALAHGSGPSGARTRVHALAAALVRRGVEAGILHGPGLSAAERAELAGVALVEEPRPPRSPIARAWRQDRILRRCATRFPFDVVVSEALPWPSRTDVVGTIHDLRHLERGGLRQRLAFRLWRSGIARARRVHAVSDAVAGAARRAFGTLAGDVRTVRNAVDPRRWNPFPGPSDQSLLLCRGLQPGFLLCAGHLEERKAPGVAMLVRRELARRGLDVPLVFAGRGPWLPEEDLYCLKAECPTQRPGQVIRDAGDDELPALMRAAAVVIAPSRCEGFGLVPLEALATGTPVVASDIPAHREVIADAGLLVPPRDLPGFVRAVLTVLERRIDLDDLRRRGLARASAFTWDASAAAFLSAL